MDEGIIAVGLLKDRYKGSGVTPEARGKKGFVFRLQIGAGEMDLSGFDDCDVYHNRRDVLRALGRALEDAWNDDRTALEYAGVLAQALMDFETLAAGDLSST